MEAECLPPTHWHLEAVADPAQGRSTASHQQEPQVYLLLADAKRAQTHWLYFMQELQMVKKRAFTLPQFLRLMLHKLHASRAFHHNKHNAHCKRHLQPGHSQLQTRHQHTTKPSARRLESHSSSHSQGTGCRVSSPFSFAYLYTHVISSVGALVSQQY